MSKPLRDHVLDALYDALRAYKMGTDEQNSIGVGALDLRLSKVVLKVEAAWAEWGP